MSTWTPWDGDESEAVSRLDAPVYQLRAYWEGEDGATGAELLAQDPPHYLPVTSIKATSRDDVKLQALRWALDHVRHEIVRLRQCEDVFASALRAMEDAP